MAPRRRRGRCPHRPAGPRCRSAYAERTRPVPLRRRRGCGGTNGHIKPLHPPREAADAARTRYARYLRRERQYLRVKTAVCSICPLSRGSWCDLSEHFCSRNDCPILLSRAKPGRGGRDGAGRPGGPRLPARCRFRGCTPRGPYGSPGAAAPGAFWELFCGEKFPAGGRPAHDTCAFSPNRPASGGCGRP